MDCITQWGDTWTVKDTSVLVRSELKTLLSFYAPRPPQQCAAFHQVCHGSQEERNTRVSGHSSPEKGWWQPEDHGLQNAHSHGPVPGLTYILTICPMPREVWSGACMTGPSVSPAPRMTCRCKNTTPSSLEEILAELITGHLTSTHTAALEECWAVWGTVTPSYWPETSNRLPSHPKQNMEESQTAILPLSAVVWFGLRLPVISSANEFSQLHVQFYHHVKFYYISLNFCHICAVLYRAPNASNVVTFCFFASLLLKPL